MAEETVVEDPKVKLLRLYTQLDYLCRVDGGEEGDVNRLNFTEQLRGKWDEIPDDPSSCFHGKPEQGKTTIAPAGEIYATIKILETGARRWTSQV